MWESSRVFLRGQGSGVRVWEVGKGIGRWSLGVVVECFELMFRSIRFRLKGLGCRSERWGFKMQGSRFGD